jgi:hypothetical protein
MKISQLTKDTIGTYGESNRLLEGLITTDYKNFVNKEP